MAGKYMMATEAHHLLGDISRDEPSLCVIFSENGENYIGHWVTGLGFVDVKFPKATTRALNEEEIAHYNGQHLVVGSTYLGKLDVRS